MALTENKNDEEIIDIDLSPTKKKKFRIDGDNSRIIELNISDVGILSRLSDSYPELEELSNKAIQIGSDESTESDTTKEIDFEASGELVKEIDEKMRQIMDKIFDSSISDVCAPYGTMFDPFNGKLRYEYILDALIGFYEKNISKEARKLKNNVEKHTKKYVGKK